MTHPSGKLLFWFIRRFIFKLCKLSRAFCASAEFLLRDFVTHRKLCFHPCLSVCLSVCLLTGLLTKSADETFTKLYGMIGRNPGTNRVDCERSWHEVNVARVQKIENIFANNFVQSCRGVSIIDSVLVDLGIHTFLLLGGQCET